MEVLHAAECQWGSSIVQTSLQPCSASCWPCTTAGPSWLRWLVVSCGLGDEQWGSLESIVACEGTCEGVLSRGVAAGTQRHSGPQAPRHAPRNPIPPEDGLILVRRRVQIQGLFCLLGDSYQTGAWSPMSPVICLIPQINLEPLQDVCATIANDRPPHTASPLPSRPLKPPWSTVRWGLASWRACSGSAVPRVLTHTSVDSR